MRVNDPCAGALMMPTDDLQTLRHRLASPRGDDWCMPPLVPGQWTDITGDTALRVLTRLSAELAKTINLDDFALHYAVDRVRTSRPACYPDAMLVEMQGYGTRARAGLISVLVHEDGWLVLDGNSSAIHEINADMPPNLGSEDGRLAYMHFFMNWVHSSQGRFQPISTAEDLALRLRPGFAVPPALDVFAPRQAPEDGNDAFEDIFNYEMTVLHKHSLFLVGMALHRDGSMEMLEDELMISDLPVRAETLEGLLLVADAEENTE